VADAARRRRPLVARCRSSEQLSTGLHHIPSPPLARLSTTTVLLLLLLLLLLAFCGHTVSTKCHRIFSINLFRADEILYFIPESTLDTTAVALLTKPV